MENTKLQCIVCQRDLKARRGTRGVNLKFCSDLCREKDNITKSNEKWMSREKSKTYSQKKDRHPWLGKFQDM